jgi:tRNA-splicing ligase RtcB (3'-phosphate/5'-hydroxy nucleic acid ligase)
MNVEHVSGFKYRIPKEGKVRVDAAFYASEGILENLKSEDYASLRQICNVAMLLGVVEPALTMGIGKKVARLRPLIVVKG